MTPEQLAEIRARLDAATPGPWDHAHRRQPDNMYITQVFCVGSAVPIADMKWVPRPAINGVIGTYREANAALIAHAPSDLRALLDEVDRLTAERDRLAEALRPFAALAGVYDPPDGDDGSVCWADLPTIGDLRRARAALAPNT